MKRNRVSPGAVALFWGLNHPGQLIPINFLIINLKRLWFNCTDTKVIDRHKRLTDTKVKLVFRVILASLHKSDISQSGCITLYDITDKNNMLTFWVHGF